MGSLQQFKITKSSDILTPKSKQKYLQNEIEKVRYVVSLSYNLPINKIIFLIYFIALIFSKRSSTFKKIQWSKCTNSDKFSKYFILMIFLFGYYSRLPFSMKGIRKILYQSCYLYLNKTILMTYIMIY